MLPEKWGSAFVRFAYEPLFTETDGLHRCQLIRKPCHESRKCLGDPKKEKKVGEEARDGGEIWKVKGKRLWGRNKAGGGATRSLVTTVNFALGKKSRGRVVRPISRGLLSNKLVSERMAMAAVADTPGRRREEGKQKWEAEWRRGRRGHKWRTVTGARGISCQMILIGSCRAIQRRPKKAKKIER